MWMLRWGGDDGEGGSYTDGPHFFVEARGDRYPAGFELVLEEGAELPAARLIDRAGVTYR